MARGGVPGTGHRHRQRVESVLTITLADKTQKYSADELLALPGVATVTIPADVAYRRRMAYRALPVATLLSGAASGAVIRFAAADGFATSLPVELLLANDEKGARAYLAIKPEDSAWPPLKAGDPATAGPYYLVWVRPERGGIVPEQWPYAITRIEEMQSLAVRFPAIVPAANLAPAGPVKRAIRAGRSK